MSTTVSIVQTEVTATIADPDGVTVTTVTVAGAYDAASITFTPDGDIAATTVQAAIVEVRDDAASALAASELPTIQTVSGATATISATTDIVEVTYAAAACTLTLPSANGARPVLIVKHNASAYGITIDPSGSETIQGGSAGASVSPTFLETASTTTDPDPSTLFYPRSTTDWGYL